MGLDDAVEGISASDVGPLKAGDMKTDTHTQTPRSVMMTEEEDEGVCRICTKKKWLQCTGALLPSDPQNETEQLSEDEERHAGDNGARIG